MDKNWANFDQNFNEISRYLPVSIGPRLSVLTKFHPVLFCLWPKSFASYEYHSNLLELAACMSCAYRAV
jgi:hypothetical protein